MSAFSEYGLETAGQKNNYSLDDLDPPMEVIKPGIKPSIRPSIAWIFEPYASGAEILFQKRG